MIQVVKQRKYIQDFCDFVGSFLITEEASISETELVLSNAELLINRIKDLKNNKYPMMFGGTLPKEPTISTEVLVPVETTE